MITRKILHNTFNFYLRYHFKHFQTTSKLSYDEYQRKQTLQYLSEKYCVDSMKFEEIINDQTKSLYKLSSYEAVDRLENLSEFVASLTTMTKLLKNPKIDITSISCNQFNAVVKGLLTLTTFTSSELKHLLRYSPNIFLDDIKYTVKKFLHLRFMMGFIDDRKIATTGVLQHSLDHIRQRHLFLTRRGLFSKIDAKKRKVNDIGNDDIDAIFNTTDEQFVRLVAYSSVNEFDNFKQVLKAEDRWQDILLKEEDLIDDKDDFDDKNDFANKLLTNL